MRRVFKCRKMTYVIWAWCIAILAWAIAGATSTPKQHCGIYQHACTEGAQAGTAIGVAIIMLIGFFGFVFFSIIWFMTRPRTK